MKLTCVLALFYLVIFLLDLLVLQHGFQNYQISCIIGFVLCAVLFIVLMVKTEIHMCTYKLFSILIILLTAQVFVYSYNTEHNYVFFIICIFSVAVTQSININFFVLLALDVCLVISGIVLAGLKS